MAKTKIVATLGPKSSSEQMIKKLISAGVSVFRLNFGHGSYDQHHQSIKRIRRISVQLNKNVAIMQDLSGPKIRLGQLAHGRVSLKTGAIIRLFAGQKSDADDLLPVSYPRLAKEVKKGDLVLLGDGEIELKVVQVENGKVYCRVQAGGLTASRKGVNLPSERLSVSAITAKDKKDLEFGIKQGVDFIALSFVRKAEHLQELRRLIKRAGGNDIPVIAKIETDQAIKNLDEIIQASDAVMVARGDLGLEAPIEEVPLLQKMIIRKANSQAKPVITATQMLQSMVHEKRPTRAEVTDVANAIYDGTDAVMLSEESAVGEYPVESVMMMQRIAREAEKNWTGARGWEQPGAPRTRTIPEAISFSAVKMSEDMKVKAIVTPTRSGNTARLVSRLRPRVPIIAISPRKDTVKKLALVWGIEAFYLPDIEDRLDLLKTAAEFARKTLNLKKRDLIVITAGVPIQTPPTTNLVQIKEIV